MDSKSFEKATGAIADKYRLSILQELAQRDSMTPSDIQELTGLSQPCVSHHVRLLTESDLLIATKEGRNVYLHLNKDMMRQLSAFLMQFS
ncbi:ArsR/SmtB family transcription factor [Spirosoma areae]